MKIRLVFVVLIWFLSVSFAMAQNAQEYYKNGYLYFSQGNYEKALESYQKALELDPQLRDAQYWLGKVYEKLGNIPEAIAAWRQVLVVQPLHKDAFQKWRAYVRLGEVDEREKARLQEIFLYQSATPSISKEEAWSTIMPYALSLMGTRDLTSLRLAGAIMRWAGKNVSALFVPYEKPCYRKALEILREDFSREDPYLVYEFLRECLMRFEGDQEILNLVNGVLEIVFATEAQISKETGGQTAGIEFRAYQDRVEKEALGSLEGQAVPRMEFYLKEHGAEGGS